MKRTKSLLQYSLAIIALIGAIISISGFLFSLLDISLVLFISSIFVGLFLAVYFQLKFLDVQDEIMKRIEKYGDVNLQFSNVEIHINNDGSAKQFYEIKGKNLVEERHYFEHVSWCDLRDCTEDENQIKQELCRLENIELIKIPYIKAKIPSATKDITNLAKDAEIRKMFHCEYHIKFPDRALKKNETFHIRYIDKFPKDTFYTIETNENLDFFYHKVTHFTEEVNITVVFPPEWELLEKYKQGKFKGPSTGDEVDTVVHPRKSPEPVFRNGEPCDAIIWPLTAKEDLKFAHTYMLRWKAKMKVT